LRQPPEGGESADMANSTDSAAAQRAAHDATPPAPLAPISHADNPSIPPRTLSSVPCEACHLHDPIAGRKCDEGWDDPCVSPQ
jgi:hypothetical protein